MPFHLSNTIAKGDDGQFFGNFKINRKTILTMKCSTDCIVGEKNTLEKYYIPEWIRGDGVATERMKINLGAV